MLSGLLITLNILVCIALIGVVLLQRSEGGAFGMGGGPTGLITARGAGDLLTRTTWVLFTLFMALSLSLTLLGAHDRGASSLVKGLNGQKLNPMAVAPPSTPAPPLPGAPAQAGGPAAPILGAPLAPPSAPPVVPKAPAVKAATAKSGKAASAKAARNGPAAPLQNAPALAPIDVAPVAPTKSDAAPPPAAPPSAPTPKPDPNAGAGSGAPQ
jgi:preprotein translocase subunit SecG